MSVIGNPIILAGGAIPKPTGNLYNAGSWNSDVTHGLFSRNGGYVAETNNKILVNLAKSAYRNAGVVIGPLVFGDSIQATGRWAVNTSNDTHLAIAARFDENLPGNIDYSPSSSDTMLITELYLYNNNSFVHSLNTSAWKGKVGYIFVVQCVMNFSYDRNGSEITNISIQRS